MDDMPAAISLAHDSITSTLKTMDENETVITAMKASVMTMLTYQRQKDLKINTNNGRLREGRTSNERAGNPQLSVLLKPNPLYDI